MRYEGGYDGTEADAGDSTGLALPARDRRNSGWLRRFHGKRRPKIPQGLKPRSVNGGKGTAEAVPFQSSKSDYRITKAALIGLELVVIVALFVADYTHHVIFSKTPFLFLL
jgi:hypothetical protein